MTLFAFSGSLSPNISPKTMGLTCHERPNLSLSQPHLPFSPPSESFSHSSSTSSCVSSLRKRSWLREFEVRAAVQAISSSPLSGRSRSSRTIRAGTVLITGIAQDTDEFLNTETLKAALRLLANHKTGDFFHVAPRILLSRCASFRPPRELDHRAVSTGTVRAPGLSGDAMACQGTGR